MFFCENVFEVVLKIIILFIFVFSVVLKFFMLGISVEYIMFGLWVMLCIILLEVVICGIYLGEMKEVVFIFGNFVVESWFISVILILVEMVFFLFCKLLCGLILMIFIFLGRFIMWVFVGVVVMCGWLLNSLVGCWCGIEMYIGYCVVGYFFQLCGCEVEDGMWMVGCCLDIVKVEQVMVDQYYWFDYVVNGVDVVDGIIGCVVYEFGVGFVEWVGQGGDFGFVYLVGFVGNDQYWCIVRDLVEDDGFGDFGYVVVYGCSGFGRGVVG